MADDTHNPHVESDEDDEPEPSGAEGAEAVDGTPGDEDGDVDAEEEIGELDLSKRKKKKKVKAMPTVGDDEPSAGDGGEPSLLAMENLPSFLESDRDYVYPELLKRVYDKIVEDKGGAMLGIGFKKQIEPPEVFKVGTKRVAWTNFMANCKSINRKPEHVLEFVLTELGTNGSVTADHQLLIKGRLQSQQLENVLRKYIAEYVTCRTCRSPNTELKKENRILFKTCKDCGAMSSVAAIKSGFRAQTKRRDKK